MLLELVSNYNGSFVVQKLIKLLIPKKREIVIQEIEKTLKTTLTQGKLFFKWKDFINNIKEKYPVNKFKSAIFHPNPLEKVKIRVNIQKILEYKINKTDDKNSLVENTLEKEEINIIIEKPIKSNVKSNKLQLKIENSAEPQINSININEINHAYNNNNKIRVDTLPKNFDAINNSLNYQFYNSPTKHSSDVNYYPSNMNSSQSINNYNYQAFNNSYIPQNMSMSNMFPSNNHYCYSNSSLPITNTNSMMLNNNFNLLNQQNQFLNAYQNQNFNYSQSNSTNSSLTNIHNMRSPLNQSYNSINMAYNTNQYNNLLKEVDMISPNFRSDICLTKRVSNTNNNSQQLFQNQIMSPYNNNANSLINPQMNNSINQINYQGNLINNKPKQNLSQLNYNVESKPENYNNSLYNSVKAGFININDSCLGQDSIEKKKVNYNLLINNQSRNEFDSRNNTGNLVIMKKTNQMNNMLGNKNTNLDSIANISPSDSPIKERPALKLKDSINSPNKLECKLNSGNNTKNAGSSKFLKFIKEKNENKNKGFPEEYEEKQIKNDDNNNGDIEQSITNNKIKVKVSFNVPTKDKDKKLSVKEKVKEKSFTNNLFNNLNSPTKASNYNANTGNLSLKLNINSLKDENMRDSNYLNLFNTNQDPDKSDKSSTITPNNNINEHLKLNQESCFRNTGNLQKFGVKKNSFSTACNEIAEYENVLHNTPSQLGSIADCVQVKTIMNNNTSNLPNLSNLRTQLISKNETLNKQSVFGFADDKADKMNKKLTIDDSIESENCNLFENNEEKSENTRESSRKTIETNFENVNKGLKTSPVNQSSNNNISNFKLVLKK